MFQADILLKRDRTKMMKIIIRVKKGIRNRKPCNFTIEYGGNDGAMAKKRERMMGSSEG